jgi:hypothetical protein
LHVDISAFGDEVLDHFAVAINCSGMKSSETIRIRVVDSNVIVVSQNSLDFVVISSLASGKKYRPGSEFDLARTTAKRSSVIRY